MNKITIFILSILFIIPKFNTANNSFTPHSNQCQLKKNTPLLPIVIASSSILILYGIFIGKYKYKVRNIIIESDKIPEAFNNYTILQISDLHIGSFKNKEKKLQKAINIINAQHADIIVFTGDFINNSTNEIIEFKNILKKIKPNINKYSIRGNHDYKTKNKKSDTTNLYLLEKEIGFTILENKSVIIKNKNDSIALIGVGFWDKSQPSYSNLNQAIHNIKAIKTKILLSHNPLQWNAEIKNKTDILLTLSGHTHGMQFGFEFGKFKLSPSKLKYPQWAGLYKKQNQYLYINRGLGAVGFHGRIGIWPEITIITLKNKN